jgi:hypothetical protein
MMRKTFVAIVATATVVTLNMRSHGADSSAAAQRALDAFCEMNLSLADAMFDAASARKEYRTTCRITSYREGLLILFTADQPIFRVPAARKSWALAMVLTAGWTIRDRGGMLIGVDYIGLTDSEQIQSGKIARLPASYAEHLQSAVHDGKIDVAVAMDNLDRRLRLER